MFVRIVDTYANVSQALDAFLVVRLSFGDLRCLSVGVTRSILIMSYSITIPHSTCLLLLWNVCADNICESHACIHCFSPWLTARIHPQSNVFRLLDIPFPL